MKAALHPYLQVTQAIKSGDARRKTAVKTISLAYSNITFADIAEKLHLDSPEDAEFIVAKAIRDGVIEAELDHRQGIMQSKDTSDVYSTREPQIAFSLIKEGPFFLTNGTIQVTRVITFYSYSIRKLCGIKYHTIISIQGWHGFIHPDNIHPD